MQASGAWPLSLLIPVAICCVSKNRQTVEMSTVSASLRDSLDEERSLDGESSPGSVAERRPASNHNSLFYSQIVAR